MFQGLRWRLLLSYLGIMASILAVFGTGVYIFFSRNLYRQLDKKLLTLAQSAAPSFAEVQRGGSNYLNQVDKVPWRDIFNRDQQSLEWFDSGGNFLGSKGLIKLNLKPKTGAYTVRLEKETQNKLENKEKKNDPDSKNIETSNADVLEDLAGVPVRTYTISVFKDSTVPNEPTLEGYIRASQSIEEIESVQTQLFWVLMSGGVMTLMLSGLGGVWLTQKAIEPIEASFFRLKQFTADASHELRGPLTAIKASIEIIQNHPERVHPKDQKKVNAISSATSHMGQLIEDLLFLARSDQTVVNLTREKTEICLTTLLSKLVILNEPFAQKKKIELQSHLVTKITVLGDRVQLTRLFSNLIQNALQYTPEGGIVSVYINKDNRLGVVSIRDTGIGISTEQLPHVFDRFWRANKARTRREGGTGLGLAIAEAIAKNHGGKIVVTSKPDVGSCFQVRLPIL
ncbi:MAG: ATP-binding protein [Xenococcaceae cyanobacterium MO_188.B19]|nr:ATP-binding protein [Xenococcaceae cyanobacterium MO_188.B19]